MDSNPYTDRIFTMAAHLRGAERCAVGIALIMTEAQTIAAVHPVLRAHIEAQVPGWMDDKNKVDGAMVASLFLQFMRTGGLKDGYVDLTSAPPIATIEA